MRGSRSDNCSIEPWNRVQQSRAGPRPQRACDERTARLFGSLEPCEQFAAEVAIDDPLADIL